MSNKERIDRLEDDLRLLRNGVSTIAVRVVKLERASREALAPTSEPVASPWQPMETCEDGHPMIPLPVHWRMGAHGDPIATFDHTKLHLWPDGSVTWSDDLAAAAQEQSDDA